MINIRILTVHIILFALLSSVVMAEEPVSRVLNYDILSSGEDVGDATVKLSKSSAGHTIVEHSHIKVSSMWQGFEITTIQSETFQQNVGLVKSDSKTVYEGEAYWSRINIQDNKFVAAFTEITKMTNQEKKQFSRLSFAISRKISANTEEAVLLSEALFSNRNEPAQKVDFRRDDFDTTFNNLPLFIQKNGTKPLPKTVNILDTEELEISAASISDLGVKTIMIGKQKIEARHLTLSDNKSKPLHLWIKEGDILPYFVRYSGEDEDGPFEIILKEN